MEYDPLFKFYILSTFIIFVMSFGILILTEGKLITWWIINICIYIYIYRQSNNLKHLTVIEYNSKFQITRIFHLFSHSPWFLFSWSVCSLVSGSRSFGIRSLIHTMNMKRLRYELGICVIISNFKRKNKSDYFNNIDVFFIISTTLLLKGTRTQTSSMVLYISQGNQHELTYTNNNIFPCIRYGLR